MPEKKPLDFSEEDYEQLLRKGPPRHQGDYFSLRHPRMSTAKRAKIFAPFAALKGFEEEVRSREIEYSVRPEKDEETIAALNRNLALLQERIRFHPAAEITFFSPCDDPHHEAYGLLGTIGTICGTVQEVNVSRQFLRIEGRQIFFEDLQTVSLCDR